MSVLTKLKQYTKEEILNKLNRVNSFIVLDEEVDGKSENGVICVLRNKIADIEKTIKINVADIEIFRCPDRFADRVVYRLKEN